MVYDGEEAARGAESEESTPAGRPLHRVFSEGLSGPLLEQGLPQRV